jgi:ABC-type transport system involved in multi-copper enzyme maturation permease subunit
MTKPLPTTGTVLLTLMGVTLRRLARGRAIWVVLLIALLPTLFSGLATTFGDRGDSDFESIGILQTIVMALLPSVFVASSIGEEIEDRTATYLWSRPIARWMIIVGKLLALAPVSIGLVVGNFILAIQVAQGAPPPVESLLAFALGATAVSIVAAGVAMLVPKHGMPLSFIYLVVFDQVIGSIPASLQALSLTRQVRLLAGITDEPTTVVEPLVTLVAIAAVWLAIGLVRLRRLEA